MTNLEFIKKSKLNEIIDALITNTIYSEEYDEIMDELWAYKWLFAERKPYGKETEAENVQLSENTEHE